MSGLTTPDPRAVLVAETLIRCEGFEPHPGDIDNWIDHATAVVKALDAADTPHREELTRVGDQLQSAFSRLIDYLDRHRVDNPLPCPACDGNGVPSYPCWMRCPVCGGNGQVPQGFYEQTGGRWLTASTTPEKCRACDGRGIVR